MSAASEGGTGFRPQALVALIGVLVFTMLPHLPNLPVWVGPIFAVAVLWRLGYARHGWPLAPRAALAAATIAVGLAVVGDTGTLFGREAGIVLLASMTALKLMETRSLRDVRVLTFLGYLLVMANLLYSQSMWMAAYLCVAVAALITVQVMVPAEHQGLAWRDAAGLAGRMLAQALPVMIVLFVLFPRLPGPLWGVPQNAQGGKTGLSDEMTPGDITSLALDDTIAFRVRFDEGRVPFEHERYWRGPVLLQYDGLTWRADEEFPDSQAPSRIIPQGDPVKYTVTLEPHGQRWLFALDLPLWFPDDAALTRTFTLVRRRPVDEVRRYSVTSSPVYSTIESNAWMLRRALQLPEGGDPQARALAAQWRTQFADPADRVQAALQTIRNENFYYTLDPVALRPDSRVDDFWFNKREGYCEHYAGAFVFLMRAAGVPARVVTGYLGGDYNGIGEYYMVRQSDAHAWAEVWLDGQGWTRVDPTSAIFPSRINPGVRAGALEGLSGYDRDAWWRPAMLTVDAVSRFWTEWVVAYDAENQRALFERLGWEDIDWFELTGLMVAVLSGLSALFLIWWYISLGRGEGDGLARAYQALCRRLARKGLARERFEGPMDFAARITRERPELGQAVAPLLTRYAQLRFGQSTVADEAATIAALRRVRL